MDFDLLSISIHEDYLDFAFGIVMVDDWCGSVLSLTVESDIVFLEVLFMKFVYHL